MQKFSKFSQRSFSLSLFARVSARELQQVYAFAAHASCLCAESVQTEAVAAVTATATAAAALTHTYSLLSLAVCVNTTKSFSPSHTETQECHFSEMPFPGDMLSDEAERSLLLTSLWLGMAASAPVAAW